MANLLQTKRLVYEVFTEWFMPCVRSGCELQWTINRLVVQPVV